jgi:hypothetical protein
MALDRSSELVAASQFQSTPISAISPRTRPNLIDAIEHEVSGPAWWRAPNPMAETLSLALGDVVSNRVDQMGRVGLSIIVSSFKSVSYAP